jgi:protein O-GlcNAc transferase
MKSLLRRLWGREVPVDLPAQTAAAPTSHDQALLLVAQGHAAEERDEFDAAHRLYLEAVATDENCATAHMNLGNSLNAAGRCPEAIAAYQRALAIEPEHASAHYNLGLALLDGGDSARTEAHFRAAIRQRTTFPQAWVGLALVLEGRGDLDEAAACYAQAVKDKPDYAEAYRNLAQLNQLQGKRQQAADNFSKALQFAPQDAAAHAGLGLIYKEHGEVCAAIECYRRALSFRPDHPQQLGDLGNALQEQGEIDEAIGLYRRALALDPGNREGYGNLLFTLNYHPDKSAEEIFQAYRAYDAQFGLPYRSDWREHDNDRTLQRRLRVGYVSPDFARHPVRHFLEPLLAHHDKSAVEVWAYAEVAQEDEVTARYRAYADQWVPTRGMSDAALAERIRADAIDIVVDLAGHTAHNRLGVFARKPAPVAVSWLGYGYTTGLSAIDYLLTDGQSSPPGCDSLFAEHPWRLETPGFAYRPANGMGDVNSLPALDRRFVTFGTLTRSVRINHRTIEVWARILQRVPGAHLLVDSKNFVDAGMRARVIERFAAHGIGSERLELGFHTPPWDVLRGIDIGLDCFPHNSGTTLFETLYMGLPYVTLAGRPSVGRLGGSILEGVGHPEWIAQSEDEYVEKAVALASDLPKLAALRANLRREMQQSALMDESGFARKVETAYREMFAAWAVTRR